MCVSEVLFHGFALCSANMSKAAWISGTLVLGWRDVAHPCVTDFTRNNSGSFLKNVLVPDVQKQANTCTQASTLSQASAALLRHNIEKRMGEGLFLS